jgi:hypothetical protein
MPDNNRKDQNQNKQQQPMNKPDRSVERQDGDRQQSGNRGGSSGGNVGGNQDLGKGAGNENRQIQKDLDTDETDEGAQDEQGEITQRNPRQGDDSSRR